MEDVKALLKKVNEETDFEVIGIAPNSSGIRGSGGGGGGEVTYRIPVEDPDNLFSDQRAYVIDAICEGPIEGPANGNVESSIYLNDTPMADPTTGQPNFGQIDVQFRPGTQHQAPLKNFNYVETEVGFPGGAVEIPAPDSTAAITNQYTAIVNGPGGSVTRGPWTATGSIIVNVKIEGGIYDIRNDEGYDWWSATSQKPYYRWKDPVKYSIQTNEDGAGWVTKVTTTALGIANGELQWGPFSKELLYTQEKIYGHTINVTNGASVQVRVIRHDAPKDEYTDGNCWYDWYSYTPGSCAPQVSTLRLNSIKYNPFSAPVHHTVQVLPAQSEVDQVRITLFVNALTKQDADDGDLHGYSIKFYVFKQQNGGGFELVPDGSNAYHQITGKTTSKYTRDILIDTPQPGPWDIRIQRITPASTTIRIQDDLYWTGYTERVKANLSYPNTALFGVQLSASQFSSVPSRAYDLKLLQVKVPTNYDPETRTYIEPDPLIGGAAWVKLTGQETFVERGIFTGFNTDAVGFLSGQEVSIEKSYLNLDSCAQGANWCGQFKLAWTDNPAWCFYDLITNDRYGLGKYIDKTLVDKWALYDIAKYCDGVDESGNFVGVPSGVTIFGADVMEPRFTCNMFLQTREEAYSVVKDMASIFRGMVHWSSDSIITTQDAPALPYAQFTNADVIDGIFNYEGSAGRVRHTVALVAWNDPDYKYKRMVEYVEDQDAVAKWGVREKEISAFGCTSRGQAHRLGKWLLYTENYETEIVTFQTSFEGTQVAPGVIIRTLDQHRVGERFGGRIAGYIEGESSIVLDHTVTLTTGTYFINITARDGSIITRQVTTPNDTTTNSLTFSGGALDPSPINGAIWILSNVSVAEAEEWRVISVTEDDKHLYTITALSHDSQKYNAIEQGIALEPRTYSALENTVTKVDANSLQVTETLYQINPRVFGTRLHFTWARPDNAIKFDIKYRLVEGLTGNSDPFVTLQTYDAGFTIENAEPGTWNVKIISQNALGKSSMQISKNFQILGLTDRPNDVTGFQATNVGNALRLSWICVDNIDVFAYEIRQGANWSTGEFVARVEFDPNAEGQTTATGFYDIIDGVGSATYWIKGVDVINTYSVNAASVAVTITTPTIASHSVTFKDDFIQINWIGTKGTYPIKEYHIQKGGTGWDTGSTEVGIVEANYFSEAVTGDDSYWIRAADTAGNLGPTYEVTYTISPPDISLFTNSLDLGSLGELSWTPIKGDLSIDYFEIRYDGSAWGVGDTLDGKPTSNVYRYVIDFNTRLYRIKAYDILGNASLEYTTQVDILEPEIASFLVSFNEDNVVLNWTVTPGDLSVSHYILKHSGTSWDPVDGAILIDGNVDGTVYTELVASNSKLFRLKAVDVAGNESTIDKEAQMTVVPPSLSSFDMLYSGGYATFNTTFDKGSLSTVYFEIKQGAWYYGDFTGSNLEDITTPDSTALQTLDGTNEIDFIGHINPTTWTPTGTQFVLGKDVTGARSFAFGINSAGKIYVEAYDSLGGGVFGGGASSSSTVAVPFTDGQDGYIRAKLTWALSGNCTLDFYTSTTGTPSSWVALGTQTTSVATGNALGQFSNPLYIGSRAHTGGHNTLDGKLISAEIYNGGLGTAPVISFYAQDNATNAGTHISYESGELYTWTTVPVAIDWNDPDSFVITNKTSTNNYSVPVQWLTTSMQVTAKDILGNYSNVLNRLSRILPPAAPSVVYTFSNQDDLGPRLFLDMTPGIPLGSLPISHYDIRRGGTGWDDATEDTSFAESSWSDLLTGAWTTRTYRVKAVDTAGNSSEVHTDVPITINPPQLALGGVSGINGFSSDSVELSWLPTKGSLEIVRYEIRQDSISSDWGSATPVDTINDTVFVSRVTWKDRFFFVRAYDSLNLASNTIVIDASVTIPGDPVGDYTFTSDGNLVISWITTQGTLGISHHEVRAASTDVGWGTASGIGYANGNSYSESIDWTTKWFYVKAIDNAGNESANALISGITLQPPQAKNPTINYTNDSVIFGWEGVPGTLGLKNYEVRIGDVGGTWETAQQWPDEEVGVDEYIEGTSLTYTLPYSTSAWSKVFRVKARDWKADGALTDVDANITATINPPSAPTFDFLPNPPTFVNNAFILEWSATPGTLAIEKYDLREGADWATGNNISVTSGTNHTIEIDNTFTSKTYTIKAIDYSGKESATGSVTVTVVDPQVGTISPTFDGEMVNITWTGIKGSMDIVKYEVKTSPIAETDWNLATFLGFYDVTTVTTRVEWGELKVWVKAYDAAGNESTIKTNEIYITPPQLSTYQATVVDNNVLLKWAIQTDPAPTLPFRAVELRKGDTWDGADTEVIGIKNGTFTVLFESLGGSYTYWVAPMDTAFNQGTPQSKTVLVNEPPDYVLKQNWISDWSGDKVNCKVLGVSHVQLGLEPAEIDEFVESANETISSYITDWYSGNQSAYIQSNSASTALADGVRYVIPTDIAEHRHTGRTVRVKVRAKEHPSYTGAQFGMWYSTNGYGDSTKQTFTTNANWQEFEFTYAVSGTNVGADWLVFDGNTAGGGGGVLIDNIIISVDGFNKNYQTGVLLAPVNTTETVSEHFTTYTTPDAMIAQGYDYWIMPTPDPATYEEIFDFGTTLNATKVSVTPTIASVGTPSISTEISVSADNITYDPPVQATEVVRSNFRYVKVKLTVTQTGDTSFIEIAELSVKLDIKLKNDAGQGEILTASTGLTVPFNVDFIDVESINVQPINATNGYIPIPVVDFVDAVNPTDFTVYLYDTNPANQLGGGNTLDSYGQKITGEFTWTVRGY